MSSPTKSRTKPQTRRRRATDPPGGPDPQAAPRTSDPPPAPEPQKSSLPEPITVSIPILPESRSNLRRHHFARYRADRDTISEILPLFLALRPPEPFAACRLTVRFTFPNRQRRDLDNFQSGIKPWIDTAVAAGVLADDSWRCLHTITISGRCRPGQTETRLAFHPEPPPPDND